LLLIALAERIYSLELNPCADVMVPARKAYDTVMLCGNKKNVPGVSLKDNII